MRKRVSTFLNSNFGLEAPVRIASFLFCFVLFCCLNTLELSIGSKLRTVFNVSKMLPGIT